MTATTICRRGFLGASVAAPLSAFGDQAIPAIGLTTGSFMKHLSHTSPNGKFRILDLPKIMRDDLDLHILDLMTKTMESFEPDYLDRLKTEAERHGRIITNLKMNQDVDMASPDKATRQHAVKSYKESIDVAHRLGCRWVRPVAGRRKSPDLDLVSESFDELIDYAEPKGIALLIENTGWISGDPDGIPAVVEKVGEKLSASPDTGNWTDGARFEGLEKAFPLAATCDFKAFQLEDDGSHPRYNLKRCFDTGWDSGFRGPWCIEHFNDSLDGLLAGFQTIGGRLRRWIREKG